MNGYKGLIADKTVKIEIVKGCEGFCICIDNYRICGSKPWGGGTVIKSWDVKMSDIIKMCGVDKTIEQLVRERDTAVAEIPKNCGTCKHNFSTPADYSNCDIGISNCNWEWRGVQE